MDKKVSFFIDDPEPPSKGESWALGIASTLIMIGGITIILLVLTGLGRLLS